MNPRTAYRRALKARKRQPLLEPFILLDPGIAVDYAEEVIKGRWKEAEPLILSDPLLSYQYAERSNSGKMESCRIRYRR
jgi:hypothetical protein